MNRTVGQRHKWNNENKTTRTKASRLQELCIARLILHETRRMVRILPSIPPRRRWNRICSHQVKSGPWLLFHHRRAVELDALPLKMVTVTKKGNPLERRPGDPSENSQFNNKIWEIRNQNIAPSNKPSRSRKVQRCRCVGSKRSGPLRVTSFEVPTTPPWPWVEI